MSNDKTPGQAFSEAAQQAVAWVADFLDHPERWDVLPTLQPGEVRSRLSANPPIEPVPMTTILEDFDRVVAPANTQWNHPGFFGYFAISSVGPGIIAEMLAATLNPNAMVWMSSPAATELEMHVVDWVRQLLGLPEAYFGTITDSASTSTFHALAAARQRALPHTGESGLAGGPSGRIYVSDQTHSSVLKAAVALGLGRASVRAIESDSEFRMLPSDLERAIQEDRDAGTVPVAVVATAGTTSTSAIDPIAGIIDVAAEHELWCHVDAAYGGSAALLPDMQPLVAGWDRADSIVINPHKWMFVPIDCSILWVREPARLRDAFSVVPEYLRTPHDADTPNMMDYGLALGRRFRALKLWMTMRALGTARMRGMIRDHLEWAQTFASWVDEAPGWRRVAPVPLALVAFRYETGAGAAEDDALNLSILEWVNRTGEVFLSHTAVRGRTCLRLSVGNARTELRHVERAWSLLTEAARTLTP